MSEEDGKRERSRDETSGERVKEGTLSYDDYAALDDGARYELANGALELMSPAPGTVHQLVTKYMEDVLDERCSTDFLVLTAPIDVILSDKEVRQPDIVAVRRDRAEIITARGIEGPPDLVVEVVSPSSIKRDREQKLRVYAQYGIPEYWIVTVELATVERYVLEGEAYTLPTVYVQEEVIQSHVLGCVQFSMNDVLRRMPELPNV